MKKGIVFLFFVFFLLLACRKNKLEIYPISLRHKGIFVINEGNFTYSNASLSFIDIDRDTVINNLFFELNNLPLGDVAQSATLIDSLLFIVVNNSGKIWIMNINTGKYIKQITGLTSPRYLLPIDEQKAYVSDLYSPYITIINLKTFEKQGTIHLGHSSEQMILYNNFVYVCNWSYGNKIYKIDAIDDQVIDSLIVIYQPNSMVIDKEAYLWVLSDGGNMPDTTQNSLPALTKISTTTFTIDTVFYFASRVFSPSSLTINRKGDILYFLKNSWSSDIQNAGVFKMSIYDKHLPKHSLINQQDRLFYGLGLSPDNHIFVSDAVDYLQNGYVYEYSNEGSLLSIYKVGIIPGYFIFKF